MNKYKKNIKKTFGISVLLLFAGTSSLSSQRHFFHRIDVGSSNIYTFVVSNLLTGFGNYLTHDMLFDNAYAFTFFNGQYDDENIKTKMSNPIGIQARELFNDAFAGVKLGYQSDRPGFFNWGIYASTHYKINQFRAKFPINDDYHAEQVQYLKSGGGIFVTFGSIKTKIKTQIEAALRYDIPLNYSGTFGKGKENLAKGLSSHFALKLGGYSWISGGLYADINHYDLYKETSHISKFKLRSMGIIFTITPKRGDDVYE